MPSKSKKQKRFMAAAAHNPDFAKRAGISQSVAKEFVEADRKMAEGGLMRIAPMLYREALRRGALDLVGRGAPARMQPAPSAPRAARMPSDPFTYGQVGAPQQGEFSFFARPSSGGTGKMTPSFADPGSHRPPLITGRAGPGRMRGGPRGAMDARSIPARRPVPSGALARVRSAGAVPAPARRPVASGGGRSPFRGIGLGDRPNSLLRTSQDASGRLADRLARLRAGMAAPPRMFARGGKVGSLVEMIKRLIEEYSELKVVDLETVPDPEMPDVYAAKVQFERQKEPVELLIDLNEKDPMNAIQEVEFTQWPPTKAKSLNPFQ